MQKENNNLDSGTLGALPSETLTLDSRIKKLEEWQAKMQEK